MNDLEKMTVRLDALTRRVKQLEAFVRPLMNLQGVDANLVADQAVVSFAAESIGSTLAIVGGASRRREDVEARRKVAELLHKRAEWSFSRVARALNRSVNGVKRLLSGG